MNLIRAQQLAEAIVAKLAPHCLRIEIAGSIRRRRAHVNDIDLVLLPRPGEREAILYRIRGACPVVTEGEQNCIYRMPLKPGEEFQLDLFFARPPVADLLGSTPGNFGTLLLCRTGSKEHNIHLVQHAKQQGLLWRPYAGVFRGEDCLAAEDEAGIFTALGLDFIPPEQRER